ncbi:MAG: HNH endonuclease [Bacteroidales bacterium]|nr:HNH endonuclease [Bacteroidales bacterium]
MYRPDRYRRGGDQSSFLAQGFPAVRMTEYYENYDRTHQIVRVEDSIAYGDVISGVDIGYLAKNIKVNLASVMNLASAPAKPARARIANANDLSNSTILSWGPVSDKVGSPDADVTYEVLCRETDQSVWEVIGTYPAATSAEPMTAEFTLYTLYTQIIEIQELLAIPIDAPKDAIREAIIANLGRPEVKKTLRVFTQNVPYWFLTPWLHCKTVSEVIESSQSMMGFCPYSIHGDTICIEEQWRRYLLKNIAILTDFTYWNLAAFVQKRNPNVPDVAAKLIKPISRNSLSKQHKYWNRYFDECGSVNCIYTGNELTKENYDLDHFIPWSFCVHDQLWNLIPASGSINSSKSNNLPSLDRYLNPLAAIQHEALKVNFSNNPNDNLLEDYLIFRCSIQELVDMDERTFASTLNKEFTPMMQTASNMGFMPWIR